MTADGSPPPRRPGQGPRGGSRSGRTGRAGATQGPPRRPPTRRPPDVDQARQAALDVLGAVRSRGAYANLTLPGVLTQRRLSGRDAALATELAYGTCRALGQLDAVLAACCDRPLAELDGPILDALRLGVYQLLHTRIPDHAALSVTVDLVRAGPNAGAAGFVNAVLRKVSRRDLAGWITELAPDPADDPIGYLSLATAHPRWITTALRDALAGTNGGMDGEMDAGENAGGNEATVSGTGAGTNGVMDELPAALAADDVAPHVHLMAKPGLITRDELARAANGEPARFSPVGVYLSMGDPGRIAAIADGRAAVQDEGSQLVALALAAAELSGPDGRWLDLAAGPGGKAALLGAVAAQRGAVVDAVEIAPHRADLVRRAVAGLPVTVHTTDGRNPGLPPGSYDRVLLDAPCTGLGALRRRPESRWRRSQADVAPLVGLQRELLESAARLVRPGGLVAYVTCSPHLAETAGVVGRRPDQLELIDARPYFTGVDQLGDGPTVQLWPHRHGTDGMFLALLRRTAPDVAD